MSNSRKKRYNPEYVPIHFDLDKQMVAETKNIYAFILLTAENEEKCYLIGYCHYENIIKHFRVDKMDKVTP